MAVKKNSILYVLKVLQEHSDEKHRLTQQQIIDYINAEYGLEIKRRSVKSSIKLLQDKPYEYDIIEDGRKGVFLGQRDFEPTDILYLNTILMGARSIPSSFALKMSNKLLNNLSENERKDFKQTLWMDKIYRTKNKHLQIIIDTIFKAILNNHKIKFKYMEYSADGSLQERKKDGYSVDYIISPYYLYNSRGLLYLLCNTKDQTDLNTYRVEYMAEVEELKNRERDEITSFKGGEHFDIANHINEQLYATASNKIIEMKVEVLKPSKGIRYIKDWFGDNSRIEEINGKCFATMKADETASFWWIMQYSEHFKLLEPDSLIEKTRNAANNILKNYTIKK